MQHLWNTSDAHHHRRVLSGFFCVQCSVAFDVHRGSPKHRISLHTLLWYSGSTAKKVLIFLSSAKLAA